MIEYVQGDILQSDAEALVNPVNCVGVMGKGLALKFKEAFPSAYKEYRHFCFSSRLQPGNVYTSFIRNNGDFPYNLRWRNEIWIMHFSTKYHWREPSQIDYIKTGLVDLKRAIKCDNIPSIAIPQLGCGLGGLKWKDVRPLIVEALSDIGGLSVYLYGPEHE